MKVRKRGKIVLFRGPEKMHDNFMQLFLIDVPNWSRNFFFEKPCNFASRVEIKIDASVEKKMTPRTQSTFIAVVTAALPDTIGLFFTCSGSPGRCLITVVVVLIVGGKFELMVKEVDTAIT